VPVRKRALRGLGDAPRPRRKDSSVRTSSVCTASFVGHERGQHVSGGKRSSSSGSSTIIGSVSRYDPGILEGRLGALGHQPLLAARKARSRAVEVQRVWRGGLRATALAKRKGRLEIQCTRGHKRPPGSSCRAPRSPARRRGAVLHDPSSSVPPLPRGSALEPFTPRRPHPRHARARRPRFAV